MWEAEQAHNEQEAKKAQAKVGGSSSAQGNAKPGGTGSMWGGSDKPGEGGGREGGVLQGPQYLLPCCMHTHWVELLGRGALTEQGHGYHHGHQLPPAAAAAGPARACRLSLRLSRST